ALPGAKHVVELFPLPTADPKRFAVAVAHLENDDHQEYERAIIEALSSLDAVQLLRFNRTVAVPLGGSRPHESVKAGHEKARRYLRASGALLLLWGTVLRREGRGLAVKLYWTPVGVSLSESVNYTLTGIELPDIFWSDLADILRLIVVSHDN